MRPTSDLCKTRTQVSLTQVRLTCLTCESNFNTILQTRYGKGVSTCKCIPSLSCKCNSHLVYKHIPNLNAIGPAVVELPMDRVSPTPSHSARATCRGRHRRVSVSCRSNTKFIEWWYRTKKTARESVNPFQRYKLLKSVMGSGRVRVGLGPRILRFLP